MTLFLHVYLETEDFDEKVTFELFAPFLWSGQEEALR